MNKMRPKLILDPDELFRGSKPNKILEAVEREIERAHRIEILLTEGTSRECVLSLGYAPKEYESTRASWERSLSIMQNEAYLQDKIVGSRVLD